MRRIGVHTSIAGGIHLSVERAKKLRCNTLQLFSHNPRQWIVKTISEDLVLNFKKLNDKYDIKPIFIHASYLINLASTDRHILERSIDLLAQEMNIADILNVDYVIVHTGSASKDPKEAGQKRAIESLKRLSEKREWRSKLLLENTAGEKGDISPYIEDLAEIIDKTSRPLIGGVVIDTCHAFAAGYEINSKKGLLGFVEKIERYLGLTNVKLIHLNDSKKAFNSHLDRHEHIGEGCIGKEGLKNFINHPALKDIPLILETPKKSEEDDQRNLEVVRGLLL